MKVLLVDDDPALREALGVAINFHWPYATILTAANADDGAEVFYRENPNLVLLDVVMRDRNGLDLLREIRRVSDVPIIMVTASSAELDIVRGLDLGCDDYVAKPFSHLELLARMKAALRRSAHGTDWSASGITVGNVTVGSEGHDACVNGVSLKLTPTEHRLLRQLVRNAGRALPHDFLIARIWGDEQGATTGNLKTLVGRLRAKLQAIDSTQVFIEAEKGVGYRFVRSPGGDLAASA